MYEDEYREQENDKSIEVATTISVEWNNTTIINGVIEKVSAKVYDSIKPKVEKALLTTLDEKVNIAILSTLSTEIQPTDRWGDPVGKAASVKTLLMRDVEKWIIEPVDSDGRRGSDGYGTKHPRIHWLIQKALNGERNHRGNTELHNLIVKSIQSVVGNVEELVNQEVKSQVAERFKK